MVGVWRIWPEHGGESHHAQGEAQSWLQGRGLASNP
jgi:hypothetical protein